MDTKIWAEPDIEEQTPIVAQLHKHDSGGGSGSGGGFPWSS